MYSVVHRMELDKLTISTIAVKEHEQVRKKAGLFDVSHMVQSV